MATFMLKICGLDKCGFLFGCFFFRVKTGRGDEKRMTHQTESNIATVFSLKMN